MIGTKPDLKNIGLLKLIGRLRQDIDVHRVIGLNVRGLRAKNASGAFFGYVQELALESIAVTICKIYEPEKRNDLNSILGIVNCLPPQKYSAEQLKAVQRFGEKYGLNEECEAPKIFLAATFEKFETLHAKSLGSLKSFRDKAAAHSEHGFKLTSLPSHDEFEALFDFAADFYRLIAGSLIDVGPALLGRYVGFGLLRLLKSLGLKNPMFDFRLRRSPKRSSP